MFLPSWRDRFSHPTTNRAARRRRKRQPRVQTLEPRSLLSVTPTAVTFAPVEQTAFSGTVASFTADDAGPFTASIDWGDGTTTTGTVTANGGGFDVSDTHTYAEDGTDAVSVVIADAADSTSATAASTANISESAFGLTAGPAISATEGVAISGLLLATFSDPGSPDAAGDFGASIDWGDGTTTAGTISGSGGSFTVTGDHTYADELSGNYAVTVSEPSANFTFGPISAPVTVAEGDSGTLISATITPTEGQAFSGVVATFTDNYNGQVASDFTANVDWGDGTTTVGTVTGGSGTFTISGDHTYADEGTFSVLASFADDAPSTLNATITSTATVGEADALIGTGTTISPIETTPFSGAVATFSDTNPVADPTDFTANIDWGDGTIDVGVPVTGGAGADLTVSGTHTYAEEGAYTIVTTLTDDSPSTVSATATSTANVSEFSLGITGVPVVTTEGQAFSGIVATASDPGSTDPASEFGATIDWGDGTTTTGTVSGSGAYTISGDHTYADEGSFTANVRFVENNSPSFPISITTPVTVAEGDVLTPGFITTGAISENELVGGTAAVFHDAGFPNNDVADFTGTFDWGDGTTYTTGAGNVSITNDGAGNITLSVAGHSYADEGVYTVVATVADDAPGTSFSSQTGTLTVTEADAFTPAATPLTISTTESTAFSGNVAVFADTGYPGNDPSDFNASIDWGDGTTDTGSISTSGDGNFTVSGSHTYADDGSRIITTTISDDAPGTATATTTATANIAEADLTLTPAVATFVVREGATASGTVATITDLGGNDPASDFTAMIDWGDGTTTAGTITGAAGIYQVAGSHSYDDEGTFTVSVTATETGPGASATATMTANVIEGDVFTSSAAPITVAENTAFTGSTLATFTDTGFPGNVAADFTAAVDWGDGTTAVGMVSGSAGTFTVSGNHTYADEGSYPVTITLSDDAPSTLAATATTTATVTEGDTFVAGTAVTANATEAASFTGTVATFSDTTYPGNTTGDFNAMIDWGDGTTTAGSITGTAGEFTVSGSHTYAEEGTMTASVVVSDDAPGTATGTAAATINVADAPLSASGVTLAATEGAAFNAVVANFTDADPAGTTGDYTATVVWGDGTTALGTISANGSGGFQVTAAHDYAEEGTDTITVTIADVGGSTATATSTAHVSDAALTATGTAIAPTEGIAFTGAVASFIDADPAGTASDYTATITWGDGTTSAGTIAANGSGGFDVSATHVYAEEGTDSVSVIINDIGGASATAVSTAHVADAPLSATAAAVSSPEFATFSGTVANFTDADPNGTVSDYTATIDWGDGSAPTAGTITAAGSSFDVSGSHAYAEDGSFIIKVTVADVGGATATVSRAATITEPAITGSGVALAGFERSPLNNITVATFQHGGGGEPAGNFTATIQWGDGSSSVGTISQSGTAYSVSGSHIYLDEQTYPVTVKVTDDAASATFTSSAKISEELLPNGTAGTPNERFISELYRDLLHRPVDSTALPYWSNLLDQGQSRLQVAQAIINAAMPGELGEDLVRGMYETLLNRDPDAAGLAFWMNTLNQGTIEQTEAKIAGTQEFYTDSGGTNDGFVTHLFQVALQRTPEASARAAFDASLAGGMSREQVAEIVFGSHEYHLREVSGNYKSSFDLDDRFVANVPFIDDLDFLDRAPDAGGLAGFTSALDNGATDQHIWAQFLASDEFFAKLS